MNDKITFPRLASMLADRSGRSKRFSEDFLREFFALISEQLEAGESVKIKGFGTFRLTRVESRKSVDVTTGEPMEIAGHSKVVFVPAKELAEAVNSPFEAFSAIEISDDADLSQLFPDEEILLPTQSAEEPQEATAETNQAESIPEESKDPEEDSEESEENIDNIEAESDAYTDDKESEEEEEDLENQEAHDTEEEPDDNSEDDAESEDARDDAEPEDAAEEEYDEFETPHRRNISKTLWVSFGAAIVALAATLTVWYVFATDGFNRFFNLTAENAPQATEEAAPAATVIEDTAATVQPAIDTAKAPTAAEEAEASTADVPTAPSDAVVYDTISTTRFLTTMAKMHYGNYNLWPYIYEENKAFLGHPDRIRPGTPVVIPKLSKYGVNPNNRADIEKAKKMGVEIYARYNKKI